MCHLDIGFSTFVANVGLAKAQGKELMSRATGQSLVTTVPEKPGEQTKCKQKPFSWMKFLARRS